MKSALFPLFLLFLVCLLIGCRTAGPQVVLRDCRDCEVTIDGDTRAAQGKSVAGSVDPTVSAAIQASDNAVSSGDATVNDSAAGAKASEAAATKQTPEPGVAAAAAVTAADAAALGPEPTAAVQAEATVQATEAISDAMDTVAVEPAPASP